MECWFDPITDDYPDCILGLELVTWGSCSQSDHVVSPLNGSLTVSIIPRPPVVSQTLPPPDLCLGPGGAENKHLFMEGLIGACQKVHERIDTLIFLMLKEHSLLGL